MIQDANLEKFNEIYKKFGFRSVFKELRERHIDKEKDKKDKEKRLRELKNYVAYDCDGTHQQKKSRLEKLRKEMIEEEEKEKENKQLDADPLSDYIKQKTISHLGFIVEAVVEAVPQSILQMVFIVIYGHYNNLNIFSILMSMIVVASKGTLLCYNIYRPTAIFNFLAFSVDIFGIFSVCAWLFCLTDVADINVNSTSTTVTEIINSSIINATEILMADNNGTLLFDINSSINININSSGVSEFTTDYVLFEMFPVWGPAYYYFRSLTFIFYVLIVEAIIGIGMLFYEMYREHPEYPWKAIPMFLLIIGGVTLVLMPATLVILTIRFTLVPMLVLQSFDHTRKKSLQYFTILFNFFGESKTLSDLHDRILLANWRLAILAHDTFENNQKKLKVGSHNYYTNRNKQLVVDYRHSTFKPIAKMKEENLSLSFVYQTLNYKGLMRYHQIREIVEFLYKLQIWKIIWKSYMDNHDGDENQNNKNGKNKCKDNDKNSRNFDILAFSDSEEEEEGYESELDENGNKIRKKKKKKKHKLTNEEKEKRAQLKSSWQQIKTIIAWDKLKEKLKDKWRYVKTYNYKRFFRLLWRDIKEEITNKWNNNWKPSLNEFWNDKLPNGIWIVVSRFGFAILQDLINIWINIKRLFVDILYYCTFKKFDYINNLYYEPRYEIVLIDWRVPHAWWYSKGIDISQWNQRAKNLINARNFQFLTQDYSSRIYFPPCYPEQLYFPTKIEIERAKCENRLRLTGKTGKTGNSVTTTTTTKTNETNDSKKIKKKKRKNKSKGKLTANNENKKNERREEKEFGNEKDDKIQVGQGFRRVYIFEGIYTYLMCFIYYFIHSPLRNIFRSDFFRDVWPVGGIIVFFIGIVPFVLFLAVYSLFLPFIFMLNSLYYYGIEDNPHKLQLVLTIIHSIVSVSMFSLLPYVWRYVYSDFHLYPYFNEAQTISHIYAKHVANVYNATPLRNEIICQSVLGPDIGKIVVKFLPKWHIYHDEANAPEIRTLMKELKENSVQKPSEQKQEAISG